MPESLEIGGGRVQAEGGRVRLSLPPASSRQYADAQWDDYHAPPPAGGRPRRIPFSDSPPLRLRLRARASHPAPVGTLGFGFWNDPFSLSGGVLAAPAAAWFFYASPPSDMALAAEVPGQGWKAATLRAPRVPPLLLVPAALAAVALTRLPGLGRPVMALARRTVQAHEALLSDVSLAEWHDYELEWNPAEAVFRVDGRERLRSPAPPPGPLGFVLWIDNQYAVASRAGRFGFGLCPVPEAQWLEVDALSLQAA